MTDLLSSTDYALESLPELWFGVVIVALGVYILLDGFDFGLGILFAEADHDERKRLLAAFGPVWKANEVWLVLFGTVLFAGFPAVYANILSRHYLLVFMILLALSLRGLGSKLREERNDKAWVRFWDTCFVFGSIASPFLLGAFVASWALGDASALAVGPPVVGLTVTVLTVVLGAAFLGVKTTGDLRAWTGRRGQLATILYVFLFALTAGALVVAYPDLRPVVLSTSTAVVVAVTLVAAIGYVLAVSSGRYRVATAAAAGIALAFVAFVATLLYPTIDPAAGLTIREAVVSPLPLNITSLVAGLFLPIIGGYFVLLYSVFRGPVSPKESYG